MLQGKTLKKLKEKGLHLKKIIRETFFSVSRKQVLFLFCFFILSLCLASLTFLFFLIRWLPQIAELKDYNPPLTSMVWDRNGEKVGEFF